MYFNNYEPKSTLEVKAVEKPGILLYMHFTIIYNYEAKIHPGGDVVGKQELPQGSKEYSTT